MSEPTAEAVLDAYRRWGYLAADLDWLGRLAPAHPELVEDPGRRSGGRAYCGTLAVEFMHIPDPARREWIQERMEGEPAAVDRRAIVDRLMRASSFEQILQTRYLGNKRFSIEGLETLIPVLAEMLETAIDTTRQGRAGDEPPRPAQRHGAHRRQGLHRPLRRLRGCRSAQHHGRRRRQVPPRRHRRASRPATAARSASIWPPTRATSRRSTRW